MLKGRVGIIWLLPFLLGQRPRRQNSSPVAATLAPQGPRPAGVLSMPLLAWGATRSDMAAPEEEASQSIFWARAGRPALGEMISRKGYRVRSLKGQGFAIFRRLQALVIRSESMGEWMGL